jgi:deoxyadenosine/deoxycytidine kinase
MNTRDLIEAAKNTVITEEKIEQLKKRIAKREAVWEEQAKANNSKEFLERYYSI